ncbi:MAG: nucleoside triphosphate pyrophosphohydrolase [Desulfobulbaceae bacterium]|nr:nucleoside triphosphate pyrophosphohydrolase [Desulfobulbaceae bacterium]
MQKFTDLIDIVTRLRAPNGCPWDQKQTPQSFKPYLIEEAHELAEAIDLGDPNHVREELGDMLFQVVFLSCLYNDAGHLTMDEVLRTIIDKMIRRHPHVFGDTEVASEEALRSQWNAIKAREKQDTGKPPRDNSLSLPPASLPALKRAQRVSESAARTGFEWPDLESVFCKIEEEIAECREAIAEQNNAGIFEEIGDILFLLANLGRLTNINTEDALQAAITKFDGRFTTMERHLLATGKQFTDLDFDALLALWRQSKKDAPD